VLSNLPDEPAIIATMTPEQLQSFAHELAENNRNLGKLCESQQREIEDMKDAIREYFVKSETAAIHRTPAVKKEYQKAKNKLQSFININVQTKLF